MQTVAFTQNTCELIPFPTENVRQLADTTEHRYRRPGINRAADPVRNKEDLELIKDYLRNCSGKYSLRNYAIFMLGTNTGLRCIDVVRMRLGDLYYPDMRPRERCRVVEVKTGKEKDFMLRDTALAAIELYVATLDTLDPAQYLFPSQKVQTADENNTPDCFGKTHLPRRSFGKILKTVERELREQFLEYFNLNTHSMRKTFGNDFMERAQRGEGVSCDRALLLLMMLLNHSSPEQTLRYVGVRDAELMGAYQMRGI